MSAGLLERSVLGTLTLTAISVNHLTIHILLYPKNHYVKSKGHTCYQRLVSSSNRLGMLLSYIPISLGAHLSLHFLKFKVRQDYADYGV